MPAPAACLHPRARSTTQRSPGASLRAKRSLSSAPRSSTDEDAEPLAGAGARGRRGRRQMPGADRAMNSCLPRAPRGLRLLSLLAATACLMSGPVVAQSDWPDRTRAPDRAAAPIPASPPRPWTARALPGAQTFRAPAGAPNILLVLVDDAGFGNPSTFGGPVATPTLDALAKDGLRYNAFHVTALCSPTRAALLTGRNQHSVGFGSIAELAGGWPGYDAHWPRSAASVARILQGNGYSTAAFGKWHLTPPADFGPAGSVRPLAERRGLRLFLGLSGRGDRPVPTASFREQPHPRHANASRASSSMSPWPTTR